MDLKAQIGHLASRFANNSVKGASGVNMNFVLAGNGDRIWAYMHYWLDKHGNLPTGKHVIREDFHYDVPGYPPPFSRSGPELTVDFTKLRDDPEYPKRGRDRIYS